MSRYSNIDLVAVDALIIPAGSIIEPEIVDGQVLIFGNPGFVSTLEDFEPRPLQPFTPPNDWLFKTWPLNWVQTAVDITILLSITPFGDAMGSSSCGLGYEIDNLGLMEAFPYENASHNEFIRMRDLAVARLAELKKLPEYLNRQREPEGLRPLNLERHQVHLVLAYRYTSEIDDYNHECDIWVEYVGQVDLDKLVMKEAA